MDDYNFEPKANKGVFLRLKNKGDSVAIRIASRPYREPKIWKEDVKAPLDDEKASALTEEQWFKIMADPKYTVTEVFHWVVIDREDGKARIYTASPMVYKAIKAYAQKDQWGDPTKYDIEVTRTEDPGNYYTVSPFPDKSDLTDDELKLISEINVKKNIPNARALSETQIDDIENYISQNASDNTIHLKQGPHKDSVPEPVEPDEVAEVDDGPINLDDIPFQGENVPKILKKDKKPDPYEDISANLIDIIDHDLPKLDPQVKDQFVQHIVIYITGLTHVIHKHAYKLGKKSNDEDQL